MTNEANKKNHEYQKDVYEYSGRLHDRWIKLSDSYIAFLSTFTASLLGSSIYFYYDGKDVGIPIFSSLFIAFLSIIFLRLLLVYISKEKATLTDAAIQKSNEDRSILYKALIEVPKNEKIKMFQFVFVGSFYIFHIAIFFPIIMVLSKTMKLGINTCCVLAIEVILAFIFFFLFDRDLLKSKKKQ